MTSHLPPNSSSSRSYHQPQFPVSPHPNQPTSPLPGPSPKPKPVTNSLINLLVIIILNSLKSELVHTALFFSERLHALIPSSELAVWLLSLSLLRSGNHQATVHLLKNTPIFIPHHPNPGIPPSESNSKGKARQFDDDPFNIQHPTDEMDQSLWDWNHQGSVKGTQRAAHSASTRCALVYSKACNLINRPKEGLEVYLKAIDRFGLPSISDDALLNSVANPAQSQCASYHLLATLSYQSHEYEKASEFYRRALAAPGGHLCWEAFEGLCQTASNNARIDVDAMFCKSAVDDYVAGYMDLDDRSIYGALGALRHVQHFPGDLDQPLNGDLNQPLTDAPATSHLVTSPHRSSPTKDGFRILGANGRKHNPPMLIDNSFSENGQNSSFGVSSFDHLRYARQLHNPKAGAQRANSHLSSVAKPNGTVGNADHHTTSVPQRLFQLDPVEPSIVDGPAVPVHDSLPISSTPNIQQGFGFDHFNPNIPPPMPAPSPLPFDGFNSLHSPHPPLEPLPPLVSSGRGLPGVKRSRSQTNSNETSTLTALPHERDGIVPAVPTQPDYIFNERVDQSIDAPASDALASAYAKNGRSKVAVRDKKRVKSNGNIFETRPNGKDSIALPQHANAHPSSHASQQPNSPWRQDKIEAIGWVTHVLRKFGKAYLYLSRFRCEDVLNELLTLPCEQKRSWRVYCLIGRARFEMLDYKSAEIAFKKARERFPHLVTYMDIYSTLLWHLRKTTSLSYLSQELQLIDPTAPETWIATGNLFSRLDDHPNALKCFKRATQVSSTQEYAYTLSGHECLMLEEYTRSLVFFRESLRRKPTKNYTAYFGLGECYFKQDKYRLARYFFEKAYEMNPSNPLILCGIGKVLERLGESEEAVKVYGKALEVGNGCVAIVRFSRAKVLVGLGKFEAAKVDLVELASTVPTEYNVRFLLGKVHGLLGEKSACVRELTYAQDLEPKAAGQIKKILTELDERRMDFMDEGEEEEEVQVGYGVGNSTTYSI